MSKTVSIRDSFVKSLRENFYHGLLIGIFGYRDGWKATSNKESGDGFSDILIEANENGSKIGIVIELKYSKTEKGLDKKALLGCIITGIESGTVKFACKVCNRHIGSNCNP